MIKNACFTCGKLVLDAIATAEISSRISHILLDQMEFTYRHQHMERIAAQPILRWIYSDIRADK